VSNSSCVSLNHPTDLESELRASVAELQSRLEESAVTHSAETSVLEEELRTALDERDSALHDLSAFKSRHKEERKTISEKVETLTAENSNLKTAKDKLAAELKDLSDKTAQKEEDHLAMIARQKDQIKKLLEGGVAGAGMRSSYHVRPSVGSTNGNGIPSGSISAEKKEEYERKLESLAGQLSLKELELRKSKEQHLQEIKKMASGNSGYATAALNNKISKLEKENKTLVEEQGYQNNLNQHLKMLVLQLRNYTGVMEVSSYWAMLESHFVCIF